MFLKLKAEESGYPGWVQTPTTRTKTKHFFESEDMKLDEASIWKNAGKRGLAKL
jgi:hypothetical protein